MERQRLAVACLENEELADYMLKKWQEMAEQRPKGISDNIEKTLSKAYSNLCKSKNAVKTLKDFSTIKGVGKWILNLMQGFFKTDLGNAEPEDLTKQGKKTKGPRRYLPQKNSVAYALLITLYRGTANENDFMRKKELIDAAEASGLSRVPIAPELGKGKLGFGGSPKDWYSGWTSMKTLVNKGLVVKSSCPAKYMLSQEGKEAARECIMRSGLQDSSKNTGNSEGHNNLNTDQEGQETDRECMMTSSMQDFSKNNGNSEGHYNLNSDEEGQETDRECMMTSGLQDFSKNTGNCEAFYNLDTDSMSDDSDPERVNLNTARGVPTSSVDLRRKKQTDIPPEYMERLKKMGYAKERILQAFREVSKTSHGKEASSSWLSVLCFLREDEVYGLESQNARETSHKTPTTSDANGQGRRSSCDDGHTLKFGYKDSSADSFTFRACSSSVARSSSDGHEKGLNVLSVPPLCFGERFEDVYEVILILDDREQFAKGSRTSRLIENICSQFKIQIMVRRLPVGDGIWIAHHKRLGSEYVLDFIVERKKVDDLRCSIRDNRYRDQKLRLLRCGLKKLMYVVEGDPNSSEAAESIKTACFTTEILEGFDVQRTAGLGETLRKYGHLTHAITHYYRQIPEDQYKRASPCPGFNEFTKRCQDLNKVTVNDVFAIQLMQVPQITEEVAMAVLDLYPTILSLATAYSSLEGDIAAQEDLLRKQSNNVVSSVASRNIFKLVWSN
ncbi:hypothetical protein UlMin_007453 [Ulmus minor]